MKQIQKVLLSMLLALGVTGSAHAGWVFVGSWEVADGPAWSHSEPVLSGRQAAAIVFGGSYLDYAISTIGPNATLINFSNYVSGYALGTNGRIVAHDFIQDDGFSCTDSAACAGNGFYDFYDGNFPTLSGDTSAYISDWCTPGSCVNYAFRFEAPEPESLLLVGLALAGIALGRRRKTA